MRPIAKAMHSLLEEDKIYKAAPKVVWVGRDEPQNQGSVELYSFTMFIEIIMIMRTNSFLCWVGAFSSSKRTVTASEQHKLSKTLYVEQAF